MSAPRSNAWIADPWTGGDPSAQQCDHGVPLSEHCEPCAHYPDEEWCGFPITVCAWERVPWPCEYERNRREMGAFGT